MGLAGFVVLALEKLELDDNMKQLIFKVFYNVQQIGLNSSLTGFTQVFHSHGKNLSKPYVLYLMYCIVISMCIFKWNGCGGLS